MERRRSTTPVVFGTARPPFTPGRRPWRKRLLETLVAGRGDAGGAGHVGADARARHRAAAGGHSGRSGQGGQRRNGRRPASVRWPAARAPDCRWPPMPLVEPIAQAPERAFIDLFATVGRDGLARSLARIGAATGDAIQVERLVRGEGGRIVPGTGVPVVLGRKGAAGLRPVEKVVLRTGLDMRMLIERGESGLTLTKLPIPVDRTPVRIRGRAGDGLYWALRAAGASTPVGHGLSESAGDADRRRRGRARRPLRSGPGQPPHRRRRKPGRTLALRRARAQRRPQPATGCAGTWAGGQPGSTPQPTGRRRRPRPCIWPVNARITSGFGRRIHPILRFARMHRGIDFGAALGHADPRRRRRPGDARRLGGRLWPAGADRPWRRHGDQLQPHEPDDRRAGQLRPPGPGDRLCRLVRPVDRPAPPLRSAAGRSGGEPDGASASPARRRSTRPWPRRSRRGSKRC